MANTIHDQRPLILASSSPRRRELITLLGIPFHVVPAEIDETPPDVQSPDEIVAFLAREKALAVACAGVEGIVLGADTIVVCEGKVLGKPRDTEEAMQMLCLLNGREHQVYTGVALLEMAGGAVVREQSESVCTRVWFRRVSEEHLRRYVATGEPMDKAGAYGAQGYGSTLIERIDGCYFNVVGMPVSRVCAMLEAWGIVPLGVVGSDNE